jgi:anhydro-N-acetylmuramic acid kinase
MEIPLISKWRPNHAIKTQDQIEHALYHRNYRLIAGLSTDSQFAQVTGALVISMGHGKFIRLRKAVETSVPIPTALKTTCLAVCTQADAGGINLHSVMADLAALQAAAVEKLKVEAGKYVDRILAIAVLDPGVWQADFDGRPIYTAFSDATRLAELSGISVIDNFPAADIIVGGSGAPLDPLPWWLLAADRDRKISQCERWILQIEPEIRLLFLPVSDGLDAELPDFRCWGWNGEHWSPWLEIEKKQSSSPNANKHSDFDPFGEAGKQNALAAGLKRIFSEFSPGTSQELIWFGRVNQNEEKVNRLSELLPTIKMTPVSALGFSAAAHQAVIAAILGLMHIDQMPANIPWLTGADGQRILGRITLGRPSSWRQLIRVMADYQPAAMKLKDAV